MDHGNCGLTGQGQYFTFSTLLRTHFSIPNVNTTAFIVWKPMMNATVSDKGRGENGANKRRQGNREQAEAETGVLDIPGIKATHIMGHIPGTPSIPAPASANPKCQPQH
jgi:hypothetical protein